MTMATEAHLVVMGEPVPNARARKGKHGHWYTPEATRKFRERVQAAWMIEGRPHLGTGPLVVDVTFAVGRPGYQVKKDGTPRAGAAAFPPCDVDNLAKGVLDALNRLAFGDDCQVVELRARKRYADGWGEQAHTEIGLRAADMSAGQ